VDGGHASDVTRGYICAKVRRFPERVYGPDRVRYPMVRTGRKGSGEFARVSWDEALEKIASEITRVRETISPEAILPFCYGGSNGLLTQDAVDMVFFRRLGASRLLRTVCAAPTSAANQALYGKMPSVVYRDYPETKLLILWGVNPGVSGIHAIPYIRAAQKNGAKLVVIDPRTTPQARVADLHLAIKPGTDVVVALPCTATSSKTATPTRRSWTRTRPARSCCGQRLQSGPSSARPKSPASQSRTSCSWRTGTPDPVQRWYGAAGASSATGMAATRRSPCWRYRRLAVNSASAAAAMP
jgi:hypothetical protein